KIKINSKDKTEKTEENFLDENHYVDNQNFKMATNTNKFSKENENALSESIQKSLKLEFSALRSSNEEITKKLEAMCESFGKRMEQVEKKIENSEQKQNDFHSR
ncbi:unnamed protein product, partial [Owenia fusiformis]